MSTSKTSRGTVVVQRKRSNDLMTFLAETSGCCCLYSFLQQNKAKTTTEWAEELGVGVQLVRQHRKLMREKITRCRGLDKKVCAKDWC